MKKILLPFAFCLLLLAGCQEAAKKGRLVEAAVKNEGNFPDFLVGVWQNESFQWGFKFERDGKISKLIHTVGVPINVEEGMYYSENPDANGTGLFILGPCETSYDSHSRILKVSIILEYFRIEIPAGAVEGYSKDLFEGSVDEKSLTWDVEWRSYSALEGGSSPDVNAITANPEKLIFKKLAIGKEFKE